MNFPTELRYTKDHEWARQEADGSITVGITEFAQSELGDIVFVELPEVDDTFAAEDTFGTVEAVKTVSDLIMPVSGKIIAINEGLGDAPESVNSDPYGEGWMIRVQPDEAGEFAFLLDADAYASIVG
jgi:glycine cleavage system H protein